MEQPRIAVICSCGYDGKLTSPLCPLHGEHGLSAQVKRLRAVNAKLLEALEPFVALLQPHVEEAAFQGDTTGVFAINEAKITVGDLRRARNAIEEANK